MTENERSKVEETLKRLEDNEKIMKRVERFLFIVIIIMIISLAYMQRIYNREN